MGTFDEHNKYLDLIRRQLRSYEQEKRLVRERRAEKMPSDEDAAARWDDWLSRQSEDADRFAENARDWARQLRAYRKSMVESGLTPPRLEFEQIRRLVDHDEIPTLEQVEEYVQVWRERGVE